MIPRVSAVAKSPGNDLWVGTPEPSPQAVDEMLVAADRIEQAAQEIMELNAVLEGVDKKITAAAKRVVRRTGKLATPAE